MSSSRVLVSLLSVMLPDVLLRYLTCGGRKGQIRCEKKVLLRERKRHTARRVASTRFVPGPGREPGPRSGGEVPGPRSRGVPHPRSRGYPIPGVEGYSRYPLPRPGMGYPLPT